MRIINNKGETISFEEVDFEKGKMYRQRILKPDVIPVDKINKFFYEDDDYEEVEFYDTEGAMEKKNEIERLKQCLSATDYSIIKLFEGAASMEECQYLIEKRREWREQINILEAQIG